MEIKEFTLPCSLPQEFYELPRTIFSNRYPWHPVNAEFVRGQIENPDFYGDRTAIAILAYDKDELVGRTIFFVDESSRFKTTGFFGYFDVYDNIDVTRAIFDRGINFLKSKGKNKIYGPVNFCFYNGIGLLETHHRSQPVYMEPRNPIYYNEHLKALKFAVDKTWSLIRLGREQIQSFKIIHKNIPFKFENKLHTMDECDDHSFLIFKEMQKKMIKEKYFFTISFDEFENAFKHFKMRNKSKQVIITNQNDELLACAITSFNYQGLGNRDNKLILKFTTHDPIGEDRVIETMILNGILQIVMEQKIDELLVVCPDHSETNMKNLMVAKGQKVRQYALYEYEFS